MTQLYKLNQELIALVESADPTTGEIDEQAFEALSLEKEEKQLNVARYIRHIENDSSMLIQEKKRIEKMISTAEARKEWLKEYLKKSMMLDGKTELDFTLFKAKIKKNPPSLIIDDETKIPIVFVSIKVVTTEIIDKAAIKATLALSNTVIPGCHIEQRDRLEIK